MKTDLKFLFEPKSIAVVGASETTTKLATIIYNNILTEGFTGKVYPVNPSHKEVFGEKCYPKVSNIEGEIDMAVIVIPAQFVFDVIKDCAVKKVKYAIIISAGFGEISEEGARIEQEMVEYANSHGMRILGPNCLGITVPSNKLDATFAAQEVKEGNIAFLSQSGAFNTALLDMAMEENLGFSHFVSLGNKPDLNELDFIEYWIDDPKVKVIGAYLEEFEDGKDFLDLIKGKTHKPIVLLHPGETSEARHAISSHTGSLAGSAAIVKTALKQNGVIQVESIEKMLAVLKMLSYGKPSKGNRTAIITNAGGPGIILTDTVVNHGLELAELEEKTKNELKKALPASASVANPVDVIGDAQADRYRLALDIVEKDQNVDSILILLSPQIVTQVEETAKLLISASFSSEKTIVPIFIGGRYVAPGLERLLNNNIAAYDSMEDAVYALRKVIVYSSYMSGSDTSTPTTISSKKGKFSAQVKKYITAQTTALPEDLVIDLALEVGLDLPRQEIIHTFEEALAFSKRSGFPVVLKATTEDIPHKSDVNALFLNIFGEEELKKAFNEIKENIYKVNKKKNPDILMQEQIKADEEIIIGTNRDGDSKVYENGKGFGHLLLFGKGGIYTEVYKDTATGLVPLTRKQIEQFVDQTKISRIIKGMRGQKELAYGKLIDTLEALQKLVMFYPEIETIDINPGMLSTSRCIAADVKIFVKE